VNSRQELRSRRGKIPRRHSGQVTGYIRGVPAQFGGDYAARIKHRADNLTFDNFLRKTVLGPDYAENAVKFTAAAKERRSHAGNAFTKGAGIQCIALATNICKLT
jgi:hypothetical protein